MADSDGPPANNAEGDKAEEDTLNGKRSQPDDAENEDLPLPKRAATDPPAAKEETAEGDGKAEKDESDDDAPLAKPKHGAAQQDAAEEKASQDEDDSDDDVPLSKSAKSTDGDASKAAAKEESNGAPAKSATSMASDSDDDVPLANRVKAAPAASKKPEAESDSDEDKPLRRAGSKSAAKKKKKDSDDSENDTWDKKKRPTSRSTPTKSKGKASAASSSSRGKETAEEWLIERYLVRWWYAEDWPPADRKVDVPSGYVEMEHYPYMYLNEKTGHVLNKRDKSNMPPCKERLMGKRKEELKVLATSAVEAQIEALKKAEPDNTELAEVLRKEIKKIKKM